MSKIDTSEVERIAKLARIEITHAEASSMAGELTRIMNFVGELQQVDIEGIEPTDQVTGLVDVWREDIVRPSMDRVKLLSNVPYQRDGYIVVKRVMNG
jgi:aspartyl-tRNA(Asn)/glutamyl-tRNA(Gln) amidotransferase subunit C